MGSTNTQQISSKILILHLMILCQVTQKAECQGANGFTVQEKQALAKSYQFRMANNIDNIVSDRSFDKFNRDLPYKIGGRDREGRPILLMWFGKWNVRNFVLSGKTLEFNMFFVRINKIISQLAKKEWNNTVATQGKRKIPDYILVVEMTGYNLREGGCLACVPRVLQTATDWDAYYPDMTSVHTLNTPRIYEAVITAFRQIVSERTENALAVHGLNKQEWTEELHKIIDPEELKRTLMRPQF